MIFSIFRGRHSSSFWGSSLLAKLQLLPLGIFFSWRWIPWRRSESKGLRSSIASYRVSIHCHGGFPEAAVAREQGQVSKICGYHGPLSVVWRALRSTWVWPLVRGIERFCGSIRLGASFRPAGWHPYLYINHPAMPYADMAPWAEAQRKMAEHGFWYSESSTLPLIDYGEEVDAHLLQGELGVTMVLCRSNGAQHMIISTHRFGIVIPKMSFGLQVAADPYYGGKNPYPGARVDIRVRKVESPSMSDLAAMLGPSGE